MKGMKEKMLQKNIDYNLKEPFSRCRTAAAKGYELSSAQLETVSRVLYEAQAETESTSKQFDSSAVSLGGLNKQFREQSAELSAALEKVSDRTKNDLKTLRSRLSVFSVALFGRTMAGKSTLMEVLTHGSGKSIGNGSQRTTRDVRSYEWNGLSITDVPGIGAFDGQKDEDKAFEAAKTADLILFLMTDDGVQSQEAECFRSVLELGKPVVCVMNVKVCVDEADDADFIAEDIDEAFDPDRLGAIRAQFLKYGEMAGQCWEDIPFVFTHLRAAFLSQQSGEYSRRRLLRRASRIDSLTDCIADLVSARGPFFRAKTFLDSVLRPTNEAVELLLNRSVLNAAQTAVIADRRKEYSTWLMRFEKNCYDRVSTFVNETKSSLYTEASDFAAEHIGDDKADAEWKKFVKSLGTETAAKAVLSELDAEAREGARQLTEATGKELKFTLEFTSEMTLKSKRILNIRRIFDWSATLIGGGLAIAALFVAPLAPAFLIASLGVAAVKFIGDKWIPTVETLHLNAKNDLEDQLRRDINLRCDSLQRGMEAQLKKLLKTVAEPARELEELCGRLERLTAVHRSLAWQLNRSSRTLNLRVVREALQSLGEPSLALRIAEVGRVIGSECFILTEPGFDIPDSIISSLAALLNEKVRVAPNDLSPEELACVIIDAPVSFTDDRITQARIGSDADPALINRARLASQLCGIIVTK